MSVQAGTFGSVSESELAGALDSGGEVDRLAAEKVGWRKYSSRERLMAEEPENIVHVLLRDIRAKLEAVDARVQHVEKQVEDLHMAVTFSLGQSTETQLRQTRQGARIDDPFARLEKIMANETPQ